MGNYQNGLLLSLKTCHLFKTPFSSIQLFIHSFIANQSFRLSSNSFHWLHYDNAISPNNHHPNWLWFATLFEINKCKKWFKLPWGVQCNPQQQCS